MAQQREKMKPFLIYHYLMRETDAEHCASVEDIRGYLAENFGIEVERRSIYQDIHEINKALLAIEQDITLEEADELLREDEEYKYIRNQKRKGYYVARRRYEKETYDDEDIRLLAECVLAAKFVDEKHAGELVDIVYDMVSTHQAEDMRHQALVKDRVKTTNADVYHMVKRIHDAIDKGGTFTRKIKFQYLKYTIQDIRYLSERKHGEEYTVIPYSLVIDNGNYYLLAYDERKGKIRTYRVDRMKGVRILNEFSFSDEIFEGIEIDRYTQGHFGMFGGEPERVTLSCTARLLDTMIDRFGRENVIYSPGGNSNFFNVRVQVYVSDLFFGWLAGFGKQIQILEPKKVRNKYVKYLKELYEWNAPKT